MMRLLPLFVLLVSVFAPSMAADAAEAPAGRRPNVLFLFSDDQRADTIAALGNEHIQTPNLDRLVTSGTSFTRAYCMGSHVGAVCVPSRAMLMTGRSLFRIHDGLQGQGTWPEQFAQAGYTTFITGKWHNHAASVPRVFQEGKGIFVGGMSGLKPETLTVQDLSPERKLAGQRPAGKIPSELFADCAVEFVERQKGAARPWLCYVSFNLPHDPRIAAPEYHRRYEAAQPPLPANFLPQHPFNNGAMVIRDEELLPWPRTPEATRKELADYYACVSFVDAQVGRILAALRASGEEEKTLIVFASDHGLAIGSHGLLGKQNLYEHSMKAPLIFAGPGIPQNRKSDALCYLMDIFPTLGELAGVAAPEGNEGISLAPVMAGKAEKVRDAIFTAYTKTQRAARDEQWKLIVYPQINKTQLFDLQSDPDEMRDLAAEPARSGEVERMTRLLGEWQAKLGDRQPLASENPLPEAFDFSKAGRALPKGNRR